MNIIFKGLPVHFEVSGVGQPLIFLHGFNEHLKVWDQLLPALSKNFKCVCIDLPGFGNSPLPASLSLKYMADAVHRVMIENQIPEAIIVGHSMGGYVTLELANYHPELFLGAALFHSTAIEDSDEKKENRRKTIDFLDRNPPEAFLKIFIPGLFSPFNAQTSMVSQSDHFVSLKNNKAAQAAIQSMIDRKQSTETLSNTEFPWLFIAGKFDQLLSPEQLSLQASLCKKAMFEVLTDSGHLGMIEEPEKSIAIINKFANWIKLN